MVSEMVRKRIDLVLWLILGFLMFMTIPFVVRAISALLFGECTI